MVSRRYFTSSRTIPKIARSDAMTSQSVSHSLIAIFLTSAVAYAGAGANGGQAFFNQNTYELVYGTVTPASGSPFNFLATDANINLLLSDFTTGGDTAIPPTGLDPRVLAGTAGLLLSPTVPFTALFTESGAGPTESITMESAAQELDNIWFSNGALGQISPADLTDPSQILAVADALGVFGGGSPSSVSLTPAGSYNFTDTVTQDVTTSNGTSPFPVVLSAQINLTELDFSAGQASVPEPSEAWTVGIALAAAAIYRRRTSPR
jgi:hypothetical protein